MIGVADVKLGEKVVALIKARPGFTEAELTGSVIRGWAGERLAKYKLPREVKLLQEIPKNQMGKVNKK